MTAMRPPAPRMQRSASSAVRCWSGAQGCACGNGSRFCGTALPRCTAPGTRDQACAIAHGCHRSRAPDAAQRVFAVRCW